jgi:hypothetical protein
VITLAVIAGCFGGWLAFCLWLGGGCPNPLDRWRRPPPLTPAQMEAIDNLPISDEDRESLERVYAAVMAEVKKQRGMT